MSDARAVLLRELLGAHGRLIVVSNRGPITFEQDGRGPGHLTAARGSGGLVTALAELGRHAPVTWVAAALSEGDRTAARARDASAAVNVRFWYLTRGPGGAVTAPLYY